MTRGEHPVHGYLLTFAEPGMLTLLDELEDYDSHRMPEENEYNRQQIEVYNPKGQSLGLAWVYLMVFEQVQRLEGVLVPSGSWVGDIMQAR
jgi:gamma-glutamylcyclotransferase (GGCT)/AIG2-like uncharacterized protein YtfP